ncbi:MAG: glutathione S-transferase N-terminal domain-containing protein [Leptospiraceae bacterium]|nr:glutathione S-transferase N-terminal domain-containing protein [Leptospiraceae bacterium]MCB1323573.1 glutathione S-transferase N-terminal domain-containing protein [Leptospiraceae bacterium]
MFKLYQTSTCPFCMMVTHSIRKMGLSENQDYQLVNAARGTAGREEVLRLGGKGQVPFLVDGDTCMYESQDIIAYIRAHYGPDAVRS